MAPMHESDHFESLSLPFDEEVLAVDREIDLLLTQMLQGIATSPAGMADRVFQASVMMLPQRVVSDVAPLRFVPAARERTIVRRRTFSRMALAASVAMAFVVGMKVCLPEHGVTTTMAAVTDADWGTFNGPETGNRSVTSLLRASDVSLNDLLSEMSMLTSSSDAGM